MPKKTKLKQRHGRIPDPDRNTRPKPKVEQNKDQEENFEDDASVEFIKFLNDQTAAARSKESKAEYALRNKLASERVKNLLEHQMAMMRLTRQMSKLLGDLRFCKEELDMNDSDSSLFAQKIPRNRNTSKQKERESVKMKLDQKMKESNEYVIFSGGPKGLDYKSLLKSDKGTFRMEIDVSNYDPEDLQINTEDHKTMHVKASRLGIRKTLKLVSPHGVDIDDVIIHYPKRGILVLEAP